MPDDHSKDGPFAQALKKISAILFFIIAPSVIALYIYNNFTLLLNQINVFSLSQISAYISLPFYGKILITLITCLIFYVLIEFFIAVLSVRKLPRRSKIADKTKNDPPTLKTQLLNWLLLPTRWSIFLFSLATFPGWLIVFHILSSSFPPVHFLIVVPNSTNQEERSSFLAAKIWSQEYYHQNYPGSYIFSMVDENTFPSVFKAALSQAPSDTIFSVFFVKNDKFVHDASTLDTAAVSPRQKLYERFYQLGRSIQVDKLKEATLFAEYIDRRNAENPVTIVFNNSISRDNEIRVFEGAFRQYGVAYRKHSLSHSQLQGSAPGGEISLFLLPRQDASFYEALARGGRGRMILLPSAHLTETVWGHFTESDNTLISTFPLKWGTESTLLSLLRKKTGSNLFVNTSAVKVMYASLLNIGMVSQSNPKALAYPPLRRILISPERVEIDTVQIVKNGRNVSIQQRSQ